MCDLCDGFKKKYLFAKIKSVDFLENMAARILYAFIGAIIGVIWTSAQSHYYPKVGSFFNFTSGYAEFFEALDIVFLFLEHRLYLAFVTLSFFVIPALLLIVAFGYFLDKKFIKSGKYKGIKRHWRLFLVHFITTVLFADFILRILSLFLAD